MILKSNEFLLYILVFSDRTTCVSFAQYLEILFDKAEEKLLNLLNENIEGTSLNIFQYFDGMNIVKMKK